MTVSASSRDSDGRQLQANITSLTAAITTTSSTLHKSAMQAQLDQIQRELVAHFMDVGRLTAANILSTMT